MIKNKQESKIPLIVQYQNMIHKYGVDSSEAYNFKDKYSDDRVFQGQARKLDYLIEYKDEILDDLR